MQAAMPPDILAVIDSLAVGFVTLDETWRITRVNAAAEPILERTAAELVGNNLWEEFPGASEVEFGRVYERVMTTRRPEVFEAFYPGLQVWFELRVQPFDPGIAVYFLDVTARHMAQEQAAAVQERLALLAQVSQALAGSEDPDVALAQLARLVVPLLADWTVVTVIDDDGTFRDVGWAHRDPSRAEEVAAYGRIQSSSMTPDSPVAVGLRTGEPVLVPYLSDEALTQALDDPAALEVARRLEPHGVAVLPLTARGRTLGMLALVTTRERGPHTQDEIDTAMEVARRAGPVLESARASTRALQLAESMQLNLLAVAGTGHGLQIATHYRPALDGRQVGGDWYDAFTLPTGSTVVTIGDAMGHDLGAIAAMAQLRTMMRTTAWTVRQKPAEVLSATDDASAGLGPGSFATAVIADLTANPDGSMLLRWSNAGHPPPVLVEPDGTVRLLTAPRADVPLGVAAGIRRGTHGTTLQPGSVLVLYTDGLIERRDRDLDLGLAALTDALARLAGAPLQQILDGLLAELAGVDRHEDDIAMLAVRVGTDPH